MGAKKWDDRFYVQAFQLSQEGLSNKKIASVFNITEKRFGQWVKDKPALKDALIMGRGKAKGGGTVTFRNYIINRLPKRLIRLWKKLNECHEHPNGLRRTEAIFRKNGEDARKHLFLYALTTSVYNINESLSRVGITSKRLDKWKNEDTDFADMLQEIEDQKDNYFESKLIERCEAGDTQAILMAARTRLKHKGYSDATDINVKVSGGLEMKHAHLIKLEDLEVNHKTLRKVYKAIKGSEIQEIPTKKGQQLQIPGRTLNQ